MKRILILFTSLLFLTGCETLSSIKKPDITKPFSKCPPQEERTLKDIQVKNDILPLNNQVKSNKSEILVLDEMIE